MDIRNHKKELLFSIIIKKIDLDSLLEMIKEQLKTKNIPSGKIILIPKTKTARRHKTKTPQGDKAEASSHRKHKKTAKTKEPEDFFIFAVLAVISNHLHLNRLSPFSLASTALGN